MARRSKVNIGGIKIDNVVIVKWIDAQRLELGIIQDHEIADLEPLPCEIIGFKIFEDKDKIILAQEKWEKAMGNKYVTIIPKVSILTITELSQK